MNHSSKPGLYDGMIPIPWLFFQATGTLLMRMNAIRQVFVIVTCPSAVLLTPTI